MKHLPWILGIALLTPASGADAQEDRVMLAAQVCIGPGTSSDGLDDVIDVLTEIPRKDCERACKAAVQTCKSVVKAIDRCGVSFLKGLGKIAKPVCRGLGGSGRECSSIKLALKNDIARWVDAGRAEQQDCESDGLFCRSFCRP